MLLFRKTDWYRYVEWTRKETQKRCSQLSRHYGPAAYQVPLDPATYERKKAEVLKRKAITEMERREIERSTGYRQTSHV